MSWGTEWCNFTQLDGLLICVYAHIMISICVHRYTLRAYNYASKKKHVCENERKNRGAMCKKENVDSHHHRASGILFSHWIWEWDRIGLYEIEPTRTVEMESKNRPILILMRNFDKCTVTRVENCRWRQIPFHRNNVVEHYNCITLIF